MRQRALEILLDQDDRRRPSPCSVFERGVDAIDRQRRQAERDFVEQQISGLVISARPIAVACCSPPDSVPARCCRRALRLGKASITASIVQAPGRPAARASSRFSSTRHPANSRRPSGTSAMPELAARMRAQRADVGALEQDAAAGELDARRRSRAAASSCRRHWPRPARSSRRLSIEKLTPRTACNRPWRASMRSTVSRLMRAPAEIGLDHRRVAPSPRRARRRR